MIAFLRTYRTLRAGGFPVARSFKHASTWALIVRGVDNLKRRCKK